ncbi:MAG: PAS domain S-box protein, partial [Proteobacteria bacterium]|nr:PAS domain S-box protein [Pseudomonadota bacterium]
GRVQDITIGPVFDHKGRVERLVVVGLDVTDRARAEAVFRESERKYRELVDQGPVGVYEIELASRRFTRVNDLVCERTGFTREELLSMNPRDLFTEESQVVFLERMRLIKEGAEGLADTEEYEVRTKAGQTLWVSAGLRVLDRDGRPAVVDGIVQDITEQKLAEKALQTKVDLQRAFSVVSSEFISAPPERIDDVVGDTLAIIGRATGADRCCLFQSAEADRVMDNTHEWGAPGIEPQIDFRQGLSFQPCLWFMDQLARFQYVSVERLAGLPQGASAERKFFRNLGVRSLLAVPIHLSGSLTGFLGIESAVQEKTWSKDVIGLLTMVGDLLMLALGRQRAAEALAGKRHELEALSQELEQADATVTTLLKRLDQQAESFKRDVVENIGTLVGPYVGRLAGTHLDADQTQYLTLIKTNLDKVLSPFARALKSDWARLTPMEIQVAQLVRDGNQSLQIADILNISPSAVAFHRRNIRRKLGLTSRKQSLMTHLMSLSREKYPADDGPT